MISIFNVTDLNFISDGSDEESLRFLPSRYLKKNISDRELIKRIFTEDISVNPEPEPVIYPEVIQKLIDEDAQTVADVAKILSLYNPADISEILQTLINENPQPSNTADICKIIQAYPYEYASEVFDEYFILWPKIGSGTITKTADGYQFNNAAIQYKSFFPQGTTNFSYIDFYFQLHTTANQANSNVCILYNSTSTTSTAPPYFCVVARWDATNNGFYFTVGRKTSTNAPSVTGDTSIKKYIPANSDCLIKYIVYGDGSLYVHVYDGEEKLANIIQSCSIDSTTTFNPKNIRFMTNISSTIAYYNSVLIKECTIKEDNQIISNWHI